MQRGRTWSRSRPVRWGLIALLALAAVGARWLEERLTVPLAGGARLIDGDSMYLGEWEVRLIGIDAPEGLQRCRRDGRDWACGEEARRELQRLIGGDEVTCRGRESDRFGRWLARCTAGGRDLNALMVERGFAVAYGDYEREERAAKAARRGLWGAEFEQPRAWRDRQGIGE